MAARKALLAAAALLGVPAAVGCGREQPQPQAAAAGAALRRHPATGVGAVAGR